MIGILINSLESGGAERIALSLAEELNKKRKDVILLCIEKSFFYDVNTDLKIIYLSGYNKIKGNLLKLLTLPVLSYRLKKMAAKNKIEHIQSHLIRSNFINVFSQLLGSKHRSYIVSHNIIGFNNQMDLKGMLKLKIMQFFYSRANTIVFISKFMMFDFKCNLKLKNKQIVIYNPHKIEHIQKLSNELITDFKFKSSSFYLVTAGRLIKRKQVDFLIKAIIELKKTLHNIEFIILGDGEEKEGLLNLIKKNNAMKYIHLLGVRKNPFKYIKHSDLFLMGSNREGLPNSIIEAMICGVPVVSSDCHSGPREIISPGSDHRFLLKDTKEITDFGALYPINDSERFSEIIKYLYSDESKCRSIKLKGQERVKEFDIDYIVAYYEQLMEK